MMTRRIDKLTAEQTGRFGRDPPGSGLTLTRPSPRLPFAPLRPYLEAATEPVETVSGCQVYRGIRHASRVGLVNNRTAMRWARSGVPVWAADRIAVRLGVHPSTVWGDVWWELAEPDEDTP